MQRPSWNLAVPALLALLSACDSPATVQPVASISISPTAPVLMRGDTLRMAALPRDGAGNVIAGHAVTWSSSAPGIVSVSSAGLLTAREAGTATITALAGGQNVIVAATVQPRKPVVTAVTLSPAQVDVSTADATVEFVVTAAADAGMRGVSVQLQAVRPNEFFYQFQSCSSAAAPAAGTSRVGTWKCTAQIPQGSIGGAWTLNRVTAVDSAGNITSYSAEQLPAAGISGTVQVVSANEDVISPVVTAFSVQPATVNLAAGAQVVEFTLTAKDAGTGLWAGGARLSPPSTGVGWGCGVLPLEGQGVKTGTFRCTITVPADAPAGKWKLELEVLDRPRNLRIYTSEQLQAAGLPYEITVTR